VTESFFSRGALLLVDKPAGMTSHDVVERVRKATRVQKIGHTGTLDPMATGLLLLCCGRAARLQAFFTGLPKSYDGVITLGRATTTYDREGETLGEISSEITVTPEDIERAGAAFRGRFDQLPPPYSAKKVAGKKFYEMARKGQEVPAAPKSVEVTRFEVDLRPPREVHFRLACSSGTYVRSIAHEMGRALGCGAHLSELRRTSIAEFRVEDAIPLADFEVLDEEHRRQLPHAIGLSEIPFPFARMAVASLEAWKIRQGQAIPARIEGREGDWVSLVTGAGELLALGQITPVGTGRISMIKPRIVLAEGPKV
jgi:tRNA pseudouridine55 synthase